MGQWGCGVDRAVKACRGAPHAYGLLGHVFAQRVCTTTVYLKPVHAKTRTLWEKERVMRGCSSKVITHLGAAITRNKRVQVSDPHVSGIREPKTGHPTLVHTKALLEILGFLENRRIIDDISWRNDAQIEHCIVTAREQREPSPKIKVCAGCKRGNNHNMSRGVNATPPPSPP